jgi:hypothetical protein
VAGATVPLHCPYGDHRTPTDKLPRPGVVVIHRYTYLPPDYSTYTINNEGKLQAIYIDSLHFETKVVSVWQNGTSCYGSEISRNAWAVTPTGQVYTDSGYSGPPAGNYGGRAGKPLKKPIVGMSPTATGLGYWLVASDGGIFTFGDARFYGSTGAKNLRAPIVGMSVTPSGKGYWLVATDGGIFTFGDARFYGSTGAIKRLRAPIVGMTATPSGKGYWLVASDGGIFTFGDAKFRGSLGAQNLSAPIAGMIPNGSGYTLIGENGEIYPFR